MNFGWIGISGYFLGYLLVYILTHTSLDIIMLLKNPGKAKYPYPKSKNMVAIIGFCISTILFWISIINIPIRSLAAKSDVYNDQIIPDGAQPIIRLIGMIIMGIGLVVGILGRWARGDYNTHDTTRLQTRLGFAIVRHPNYFQYMCGFIGIPLISLHLFTLIIPMIGIYGYYIIAKEEENRLLLEFGEEYQRYMDKVGMFFPKASSLLKKGKQIPLKIIMRIRQIPARKVIGTLIKNHQRNERNWVERTLMDINEFILIQKEREFYPSHPYFSADENSDTIHYQNYAETMR